ncbi:MAG: outer membrane protein assembly factor BamA [Dissulfurispiraceae bacterium]
MKGALISCFILSLFLVSINLFCGPAYSQEVPVVTAIEVKGVKRIEEGSVKAKISQKIGEPLSDEKTSDDIKAIFKMGYFDDVKVNMEPFEGGLKLIYMVEEKPTIIKVDFQGNKEFDDSRLKEKTTITAGAISDINLINDNAIKLRAFYEDEGYYLAKVVPVVRKAGKGEVVLTFQINEGEKVKIRDIRIEGNKAISAGKIKAAMKTKVRGWLSFIFGTGYYKKDEMRADIDRIRDVYYDKGYIKVTVGEPVLQLTDDKKGMKITISVSEGDQFKVSSVEIAGNKAYKEDEVRKLIKISPGKVFDKSVLSQDVVAISDKYANNGFALVSVFPDLIPDEEKKTVRVVFRITEGDKYTVGKISITGNTKTRDKVIRREIRLDEGDTFDASSLKRTYERLKNLQFFETVDIQPKPLHDEKIVDLDVAVKEKSTGSISVGGGYSTLDHFMVMFDVTQSNLDGSGRGLRLKAQLGSKSSFYEISYKDPWFMDKPYYLNASVYKTYRVYGDFDSKATGFSVSLAKNLSEYWVASLGYNLEQANIYNVATTASSIITDQEGTKLTSAISPAIARDTRDNYLDPTTGSRNSIGFTFAGLGGSNDFIKALADSSWYFPVPFSSTFMLRGRFGYEVGLFGKEVPLYQRFFLGDINTIRGINYGDAGPKDVNSQPFGGLSELIFNAEYVFPVVPEYKFKGVVFADAGRAYGIDEVIGSNLTYTTGFGIRWVSPMGPIRVEWGYNLNRYHGEASSKLGFTFGAAF